MPYRKTPLVTNHLYHVYNQGIDRRPVFLDKRGHDRAMITMRFYQYDQSFVKLAHYLDAGSTQLGLLEKIESSARNVSIVAYCLMPNHFHFVLRQENDQGISRYLADFQNSYTKYFNAKSKRKGSLFLSPFKAVRVQNDEQLLHLVRYVHLNPFSSAVVGSIEDCIGFPYSSAAIYLRGRANVEKIDKKLLDEYFDNSTDHEEFIRDQADYQRRLEQIKHLVIEEVD